MFPSRYFPTRFFAPRYWPKVGAAAVDPVGEGLEYSTKSGKLDFFKRDVDRLNYSDKSPAKLDYSDKGPRT